jgi:gamma-glutamylputrescine oxidase
MPENHVNSYYAATLNDRTRYPVLEGSLKVDVCVVGGGFSGVASALTMAERGYSVVLLESNQIGWGASGRNGGQMIAGISGEGNIVGQLGKEGSALLHAIRYRGHDIIESRIAKYDIACDLTRGWMEAAARPRHMDNLRRYVDERREEGDGGDLEIIEPRDIESVLGTKLYHGGYVDRRSGHLHPLNLCAGEARAAASIGVRIYEDSEALEINGGATPHVVTAKGRVDAATIVLAGSTDHAFQRGRLRGLTFPTGSYIIATEPLTDAEAASVNPQNLAVADSNIVLDYFRLSADRRMLFGGRCNYSNRDPKDLAATLQPRLVEIFPQLRDKRIDFSWGGRIDIVLTRIPAIGRLEPNVYYMQGYCGHGVNATHIAAEIVADAICGTTEKFDLFDKIRQIRLPVGRWAGNQMLALGMLYYRLKDAL